MINDRVIKDIYKTASKPPKDFHELRIFEFIDLLQPYHRIVIDDEDLSKAEVILEDLEDTNPFRRFLVRSIYAILEFDKMIAFVFHNHILFLGKRDNALRVHFKPNPEPEQKASFFDRLFGRRRD